MGESISPFIPFDRKKIEKKSPLDKLGIAIE
jgi:hypothetical protein